MQKSKVQNRAQRITKQFCLVLFVFLLCAGTNAQAATTSYKGELSTRSAGTITIQTGKALTFWVEFKNTGMATWTKTGKNFVALNVTDPAGRKSVFRHSSWKTSYRPTLMTEASVVPGKTGRFAFALQAPKTAGTYQEHFQLVAENKTWISGTTVSLTIIVTPPPPPYQASVVQQSSTQLVMKTGTSADVWVDVKNTGTVTWKSADKHYVALNVTDPAGRTSAFKASSWKEFLYRPTRVTDAVVKPGQVTRLKFTIQAPTSPGSFTENFQLVAEGLSWINGSHIAFPISVESPVTETAQGEPVLDVGIATVTQPLVVSSAGTMTVTSNGTSVATAPAGTQLTLSYANGTYSVTGAPVPLSGTSFYNVVSDDGIMEAVSFENRPAWNTTLNDNTFRGSLSLRASDGTGTTWIVNTLPMEQYLRGIGEASNSSHPEYQKALMIAARSYAYYHATNPGKHTSQHFTLDAINDQVYRGYNLELRTPNITKAVQDTYAKVVTYQGAPVLTPYFANTDGRTRAWQEVWSGGPYAWLVSVPAPEDAGMTLYGHGVGLSGHAGLVMASSEGKTYDQILAYFYTGTSTAQLYTAPATL